MAARLAFPEVEAQTIIEYARRTGEPEAEQIVGKVRDWLGRPEMVMDRAEAWDPKARKALVDAKESIAECRGKLAAYWEGPAYDSFSTYLDRVEKVLDDMQRVMGGMSGLMQNSRDTVTETYQAAIQSIGRCATDILVATGATPGTTTDWLGALGDVAKVLANFIRDVADLESRAIEIITEYTHTGSDLRQHAADVEVAGGMPPPAGLAEDWNVRRQS